MIDLDDLDGPQQRIVRDAFLAAFDEPSLRIMVSDELDRDLDNVVAPAAFEVRVFNLVRAATKGGWNHALIEGAERTRSTNARIKRLRSTLEATVAMRLGDVDARVKKVAARGLEGIVRNTGFADWGLWFQNFAAKGFAICSVEYRDGVQVRGGTGFLIAPDLVLTNYHVVEDHLPGSAKALAPGGIECRFGYSEKPSSVATVKLKAPDWLADHSPYSPYDPGENGGTPDPDHLDYAVLRLERTVDGDLIDGARRGTLPISKHTAVPSKGDIVFIGQHPKLQPLQLGVGAVLGSFGAGTRIRHDADTDHGSSGSPCIDLHLNVVALHHAGDPDYTKLLAAYNQAIPASLIAARMGGKGITLGTA